MNSVQQTASRESGDTGLEKEIVHLGRGLGACRPASAACVGDEQQEPRPGAFKAAAVQEEPQIRNLGLPGMYWIMRSVFLITLKLESMLRGQEQYHNCFFIFFQDGQPISEAARRYRLPTNVVQYSVDLILRETGQSLDELLENKDQVLKVPTSKYKSLSIE